MTKENALLRLEERYDRLKIAMSDAIEKMNFDDPVLDQALDLWGTAMSLQDDLESNHAKMSDKEFASKVSDAEIAICDCINLCGWVEVEDLFLCCTDNDSDSDSDQDLEGPSLGG